MKNFIFKKKKFLNIANNVVFERDEDSYFCNLTNNVPALEIAYTLLTNNTYEHGILFDLSRERSFGYKAEPVPDWKQFKKKMLCSSCYFIRSFVPGTPKIEITFSANKDTLQIMFWKNNKTIQNIAKCESLLKELYSKAENLALEYTRHQENDYGTETLSERS